MWNIFQYISLSHVFAFYVCTKIFGGKMIYHRKPNSSINLNTGAKKEKENTENEEKQVLCPPEELALYANKASANHLDRQTISLSWYTASFQPISNSCDISNKRWLIRISHHLLIKVLTCLSTFASLTCQTFWRVVRCIYKNSNVYCV